MYTTVVTVSSKRFLSYFPRWNQQLINSGGSKLCPHPPPSPQVGGTILPDWPDVVRDSQPSRSHCTMSVSVLSPTRALGSLSGLLQVASLFGLVLLLLRAAQLYLRRQWLLKALQEFPCPPSHWLFGHQQEVKASGTGEWEGKEGRGSPSMVMVSKSAGQSLVVREACGRGGKPSLPLRWWLLIPCAGVLSLLEPRSLGRSEGYFDSPEL